MSPRRFALLAAFAFFVAFLAANVIANSWFKSWRLDLTENSIYSLSEGTQRTLNQLSEPVELTLYYSRDAATRSPAFQAYAVRVREMLQTFQARSRGRVRFVEVDVEPFSEEEDAAVEAGIQPARESANEDPVYLGLVGANAIDDERVIPFLDPQREPFLEYEITKLIFELENPEPTRVALISSLPLDPSNAEAAAMFGGASSVFAAELGRLMDVTVVAPDFTSLPDADVLVIIHPAPLTQQQLYAIDQFILRKGRAFIAVDPAALTANPGGMNMFAMPASAPPSSSLEPLLSRWGVALSENVVVDLDNALPVQAQDPRTQQPVEAPQPLFFSVPPDSGLDDEDLMTAWLTRGVNFGAPGALSISEREGLNVTTLARTSGRTMRLPAEAALARPSPFEILNMWPPSGGRVETIAVRLSGNLQTAFPNGAPAAESAAADPEVPAAETAAPTAAAAPAPEQPALAQSATPAEVVVVADVDFLDDIFYFDRNSGASAADNGAFALNAIDVLGGSDALVSLRSRAAPQRRMDLIEDMERDAQRRIQRRQDELQAELQQTEARLQQLQAGRGVASGNLGELTAEQSAEIDRFRRRVVEVRGELRTTVRELRADVDRLQAGLVFLNMWLGPLLVAGAGLFMFWRRQRRGRARS